MNKGLFTSNTPEWETPQDFFDELNEEFNFNLDPCATPEIAKCKKYFTKEDDGLKQDWGGITYSVILPMVVRSVSGSKRLVLSKRGGKI